MSPHQDNTIKENTPPVLSEPTSSNHRRSLIWDKTKTSARKSQIDICEYFFFLDGKILL